VETRIEMLMDDRQGRSQKNVLAKKRELGLENMTSFYVLHFADNSNLNKTTNLQSICKKKVFSVFSFSQWCE